MLVLIALLIALIPAVAILYPFIYGSGSATVHEDERSTLSVLSRRWEAAIAGLKNSELERGIGNLAENDYLWLREQYMTEAALVMKAMELEDQQEQEMLARVKQELHGVQEGLASTEEESKDKPRPLNE